MPRILAALLTSLIFNVPFETRAAFASGGSMVWFIPYNGGMILAADSRASVQYGSSYCDGTDKIFPVKNHPAMAFAMTGNYNLITSRKKLRGCAFIAAAVKTVDFRTKVAKFLEGQDGKLDLNLVRKIEKTVQEEIQKVLPQSPGLVAKDGSIINVLIAEHSPDGIAYGGFKIIAMDKKKTQVAEEMFMKIVGSESEVVASHGAGAAACFDAAKTPGGRRLLGPNPFRTLEWVSSGRIPVNQVTREQAISVSREMIEATITASNALPQLDCRVGGPLKIYDLTSGGFKPVSY